MRKPTRSIKLIRRMIERARRERVMVVLHPDTAEWMALLAAARTNCVLEPKEAKNVVRLLGMLQNELEAEIDSNIYHKKSCAGKDCKCWKTAQGPEVQKARHDWKAAEDLIKTLTGAKT
jgi:hypothetical protein